MSTAVNIIISEDTRRALYETKGGPQAGRVKIAQYYHSRYVDERPDYLRNLRAWSIVERNFRTEIRLSDTQIAEILQLALDHDVNPKPYNTYLPNERGVLSHLMSTFLEAVMAEHLIEVHNV